MDLSTLVVRPGGAVRGWGAVRAYEDGLWFEPDHAVALGFPGTAGSRGRWRHAMRIRTDGQVRPTTDGSPPGWTTITGIWTGDAIELVSSGPGPWRGSSGFSRVPAGPRDPRSAPGIEAVRDEVSRHAEDWTVSGRGWRVDTADRLHLEVIVCRVTTGLADWAAGRSDVVVHADAALLPLHTLVETAPPARRSAGRHDA